MLPRLDAPACTRAARSSAPLDSPFTSVRVGPLTVRLYASGAATEPDTAVANGASRRSCYTHADAEQGGVPQVRLRSDGSGTVRLSDLPLSYRLFLAGYRWRRSGPVAPAALRRSLDRCRVALVTTAGLVVRGDRPFDLQVRGGDWSWRTIPSTIDARALASYHRSDAFDRRPMAADINVAFPIDALKALVVAGAIGDAAPRHLSFMGSITAPARLVRESAPAAADLLVADQVDVALLVPI